MAPEVLIVTPLLAPAPGGGAQYTAILARELVARGIAGGVTVLTEAYPGEPVRTISAEGRLRYHRAFPFRAGRSRKDWLSYIAYTWQNVLMLVLIPWRVRRDGTEILLIHSSLHLNRSTIGWALRLARMVAVRQLRLIADVRDPNLEDHRIGVLFPYDQILCCGDRIKDQLAKIPELTDKLTLIPVIFSGERPTPRLIEDCLARHGLKAGEFLFFPNGLVLEKGIELAIRAVRRLEGPLRGQPLVVAGKARATTSLIQSALDDGTMIYLGPLPNADILCLSAASTCVLNVSAVEGVARSALEAFAVGARILLPWGIPEFERNCPEHVARNLDPASVATSIGRIVELPPPSYPLGDHHPDHVMHLYRKAILGSDSLPNARHHLVGSGFVP